MELTSFYGNTWSHHNDRFCPFSQKGAGTSFQCPELQVSADHSECVKVKSSNKCLDLMHIKFHGSAAPTSWSGSKLFRLPSYKVHGSWSRMHEYIQLY